MFQAKPDWQEVRPLGKVGCSSHDCERDLHCFRQKRPADKSYRNGRCVSCNVDLIEWERLDKKDLGDTFYTVQALEYEMIRHFYWHKPIDEIAINHARRKGLIELRHAAQRRIEKYVSLPSFKNYRDGRQTPFVKNVIFYAQHATATCCRKCAEEWHGIDRNRDLTADEVGYMTELVMLYVKDRLPDLPVEGQKVPPMRNRG